MLLEPDLTPTMEHLLKQVDDIVRVSMVEGTDHDYGHVQRVFGIATMIAKKEDADLELVQVGALLHDIGRGIGEPHGEIGAKRAREILDSLGYPRERTARVERIVRYHNFSGRDKLDFLEEKVVWDADKIDGFGAVGITRMYYVLGRRNLPFGDLSWDEKHVASTFNLLNTGTAKRLAGERFNFMINFRSLLEKELTLADLSAAMDRSETF